MPVEAITAKSRKPNLLLMAAMAAHMNAVKTAAMWKNMELPASRNGISEI